MAGKITVWFLADDNSHSKVAKCKGHPSNTLIGFPLAVPTFLQFHQKIVNPVCVTHRFIY